MKKLKHLFLSVLQVVFLSEHQRTYVSIVVFKKVISFFIKNIDFFINKLYIFQTFRDMYFSRNLYYYLALLDFICFISPTSTINIKEFLFLENKILVQWRFLLLLGKIREPIITFSRVGEDKVLSYEILTSVSSLIETFKTVFHYLRFLWTT